MYLCIDTELAAGGVFPNVFLKVSVLEAAWWNFQSKLLKNVSRELIFNKVAGLEPATLLKMSSQAASVYIN